MRELNRKVRVECRLVDNDTEHLCAQAGVLDIAKTYTDYRDVLSDPDVDAVSICSTPHPLHAPLALSAAIADKHILVEKPMALTVDERGQPNDRFRRSERRKALRS